jgi:hypothetical protein
MTSYYTVTKYDSRSALETALEGSIETSTTLEIIPFKEGQDTKFLVITPSPWVVA